MAAGCHTDHYLMLAKVRENLAVNGQISHRFREKHSLWKLNYLEGKEKYHGASSGFAALDDLDAVEDINSAWEIVGENMKISAKESFGC
jgi:hypothetical protein